jgi:hypothetical protein
MIKITCFMIHTEDGQNKTVKREIGINQIHVMCDLPVGSAGMDRRTTSDQRIEGEA